MAAYHIMDFRDGERSGLQIYTAACLNTRILPVNTCTGSPSWFNVVLRTFTKAWFGFERDGTISTISLSTRRISPARVGRGQAISPPAPMMPAANGSPPVTMSRMVIAAVCQPLAASPPKMLPWAAAWSRWKGCGSNSAALGGRLVKVEGLRIELRRERFDTILVYPIHTGREPLPYVKILQVQWLRCLAHLLHSTNLSRFPVADSRRGGVRNLC